MVKFGDVAVQKVWNWAVYMSDNVAADGPIQKGEELAHPLSKKAQFSASR